MFKKVNQQMLVYRIRQNNRFADNCLSIHVNTSSFLTSDCCT